MQIDFPTYIIHGKIFFLTLVKNDIFIIFQQEKNMEYAPVEL